MLPSFSRIKKFVRGSHAVTEMYVQLKWIWMMGGLPWGPQAHIRVGRSLRPDASMKTISRSSRRSSS